MSPNQTVDGEESLRHTPPTTECASLSVISGVWLKRRPQEPVTAELPANVHVDSAGAVFGVAAISILPKQTTPPMAIARSPIAYDDSFLKTELVYTRIAVLPRNGKPEVELRTTTLLGHKSASGQSRLRTVGKSLATRNLSFRAVCYSHARTLGSCKLSIRMVAGFSESNEKKGNTFLVAGARYVPNLDSLCIPFSSQLIHYYP
jgi:hypothetical protein